MFEQSAAVFAALAGAPGPIDAATIAAEFKQGKSVEGEILGRLRSLARLGYVSTSDGVRFVMRRAA